MMDIQQAREALADAAGAQARLAQAMDCPPWRHAAFGAIMGVFVGAAGLPTVCQVSLTTVALAATAALALHDRRRMGIFVNGYRRGATLGIALSLLGTMLSMMFGELHLRFAGGSAGSRIALALIAAAVAIAASVAWQRVYVRELTRAPR